MIIKELQKKYHNQIDPLDLEILISHVTKKPREFILSHPEHKLSFFEKIKTEQLIKKRIKKKPIAYLTGHKDFFGLDFLVNRHTLIPRPETELIVQDIIESEKNDSSSQKLFIDVGTGSGNIIISLAHHLSFSFQISFIGTDISKKALKIAKKNAKVHNLRKKIIFIRGDLLKPVFKNSILSDPEIIKRYSKIIILANLPYLSKEIFENAPADVRKYEPKTALYSPKKGLWHYKQLLEQIHHLSQIYPPADGLKSQILTYLEISPEQKESLEKIITSIFPEAKIEFQKDLAGKYRICKITLNI